MIQCMDSENLHRRLKKIIGQVQAIDRMIDEDVPCEDILSQINAAKSALHKAGQVVLEGHIKHCVRDGIEHGDAEFHCPADQGDHFLAVRRRTVAVAHSHATESDCRYLQFSESSCFHFKPP